METMKKLILIALLFIGCQDDYTLYPFKLYCVFGMAPGEKTSRYIFCQNEEEYLQGIESDPRLKKYTELEWIQVSKCKECLNR